MIHETPALERFRVGGLTLNCALAGDQGAVPVLLLHGWPQTHHAWRHVIPILARTHRVVAPDLPGFGASSKPAVGYEKVAIANLVHALMSELGHESFHVVGHDVGGQLAYPMAALHPEKVRSLTFVEAGIPGLGDKDDAANPWRGGSWHFGFNMLPDLPEALVAGREREYLRFLFFRDGIGLYVGDAIDAADLDIYAAALAQPGGLRGSFGHYRALMQDREDNRRLAQQTRLALPTLVIGAEHGVKLGWIDTVKAACEQIESALVPRSGHYLPEEQPQALLDILIPFLERAEAGRGDA